MAFKSFYSGASSGDKCTLFSDRNLINRRNVKADVSSAANPCRKFFELEVSARLMAAAMQVLGMESLTDAPKTNSIPANISEAGVVQQRMYLRQIAALVIDKFVIRKDAVETFLLKILSAEEFQASRQRNLTVDGRFMCRYPGCGKTFAYNGKRMKDHESTHNPPVPDVSEISLSSQLPETPSSKKAEKDDMFNYQCSFLEFALIIVNFFDAIKEGDGKRVVRCWKFQLPYLRNDPGSTKYALEALGMLFQVHALLPPRDAHRLIWNRSASTKSGFGHNIPLDLVLEFMNRLMKEVVRKLGPNATNRKSIDRYCHAVDITKTLLENFDRECSVIRRSGVHYQTSQIPDLHQVVSELSMQKAFCWTPGRAYGHYRNCKSSLLEGFDLQGMFRWINMHKKNIIIARRAR